MKVSAWEIAPLRIWDDPVIDQSDSVSSPLQRVHELHKLGVVIVVQAAVLHRLDQVIKPGDELIEGMMHRRVTRWPIVPEVHDLSISNTGSIARGWSSSPEELHPGCFRRTGYWSLNVRENVLSRSFDNEFRGLVTATPGPQPKAA